MNTGSMHVDIDAAFRGIESRYHKKRSRRKAKTLYSSMADDCATTEDEEEGIIITDDDVMSPRKSTAQMITLVGTDGAAPRPSKGLSVPSANVLRNPLVEAMIARPYYRRTMTFQSFHLPAKPRGDVGTRSAKADLKKLHHLREVPRRNRNTLRKLPLYRMKNDLKRKLHKLERRLSRIKKDEEIEKIVSAKQLQLQKPSPPQIKTPTHISGLISQAINKTSRSTGVRSVGGTGPGRRMYSSREMIQRISESTQNLQILELELSARKEEQRNRAARSVSSARSSPKNAYEASPPQQDEPSDTVMSRQKAGGGADESPASTKSKPRSIRSRRDKSKQTVKPAKKKLRKRKPKKHKANLRGFKQEIPIEGMNYKMEIVLDANIIARTRSGNIDFRKEPKLAIKTTKTTDLRDEFSSYCGQRTFVKNWLFQV